MTGKPQKAPKGMQWTAAGLAPKPPKGGMPKMP